MTARVTFETHLLQLGRDEFKLCLHRVDQLLLPVQNVTEFRELFGVIGQLRLQYGESLFHDARVRIPRSPGKGGKMPRKMPRFQTGRRTMSCL
jgi:hypothetical protein